MAVRASTRLSTNGVWLFIFRQAQYERFSVRPEPRAREAVARACPEPRASEAVEGGERHGCSYFDKLNTNGLSVRPEPRACEAVPWGQPKDDGTVRSSDEARFQLFLREHVSPFVLRLREDSSVRSPHEELPASSAAGQARFTGRRDTTPSSLRFCQPPSDPGGSGQLSI
jgi:hypothetical protein